MLARPCRSRACAQAGGRDVRVLVVEDDGKLAEAIGAGLRREQMAVDVAFDGTTGLSARW